MKIKSKKLLLFGIIAAIVVLFLALVNFFTDWLWFKELGYVSVFFKELLTKLSFGVPAFIVLTTICYFYLRAMKKSYYAKIGGYDMLEPEKKVNLSAFVISAVYGIIASFAIANNLWFQLLQFTNSTDFNIADPIFNQDVSFYIFRLEFITLANKLLIALLVGFVVINILFYLTLFRLRKPQFFDEINSSTNQGQNQNQHQDNPFGENFSRMFGGQPNSFGSGSGGGQLNRDTMRRLVNIAQNQFRVIGAMIFVLVAVHFFLQQFSLLYTSSSGVVYGAGFTDITITLWVYRITMVLALVGAVMFAIGFNKRKLKTVLMVPAAMVGVTILGLIVGTLTQNFAVDPDELNKERPYLENNIEFTRYAYDLQEIEIRQFAADNSLTSADIQNNMGTISNIRINDYEPAEKFYNQTQSIRKYYEFLDVDVDRYMVNGEYTQTFLSARELEEAALQDQWLTRHLQFTHGYGITLSRVDQVTASGQPEMLIDSIPPVSEIEEIAITNPGVYFGENSQNYIVVNTSENEFDYPAGDGNVNTNYDGAAGIDMSFMNRLLFTIREGSLNLLISPAIDGDSKIIINRNIIDRVQTIAPFLIYDDDPYIVTVDGGLYWIIDAYTASSYYPYSEPYSNSNVNYIRNSVKVVIDAYNGDTSFYVVDEEDPIAMTLQKIYPDLFMDIDEMPESLKAHIRYPHNLFSIQAKVYQKYHMTDADVFYQNEDGWDIAIEIFGTEEAVMEPTYYIMKIPGEDEPEFITAIPYTPSNKKNMTALFMARNDGENYGDLILFQLPKDRTIAGPRQVEARINQDAEIAQDFTLWDSGGSTYTRGNIFVIPIENSLIYVETIYLESANSSLPEVKKVIIYYDNKIAYEDTLAEALDSMFGNGASENYENPTDDNQTPSDGDAGDLDIEELAALANEAYENALQAQQDGDWAAYGRYIELMGEYLDQMIPQSAPTDLAQ